MNVEILNVEAQPAILAALLEGLVAANVQILDLVPLPSLYRSGVRYQREPKPPRGRRRRDNWKLCNRVYLDLVGDCEDLVGWRVAELRRAGEDAYPLVYVVRPGLLHTVVERANGAIEDPSRRLGM